MRNRVKNNSKKVNKRHDVGTIYNEGVKEG